MITAKKLTSLAQWLAAKLGRGAADQLVEIDEQHENQMPAPVPVIIAGTVNSGGALTGNSATGTLPVTEASAATIATQNQYIYCGTLQAVPAGVATDDFAGGALKSFYRQRRIGIAMLTLAGGVLAATELIAAVAGYYPVMKLKKIISDTTDTYTLTFTNNDGDALDGLIGGVGAIACTANQATAALEDLVLYRVEEAKNIRVAISGGGGAEKITLEFEYWYET